MKPRKPRVCAQCFGPATLYFPNMPFADKFGMCELCDAKMTAETYQSFVRFISRASVIATVGGLIGFAIGWAVTR